MLGLLVQLAISWLLVWLFERNDLRVLGLRPTPQRLRDFALFFFLTALCCASGFLLKMAVGSQPWERNPTLTFSQAMEAIWWHLRSVLFEELIFRGVLLYLLLRRFGTAPAILVSALAFGIYHWFSFGVLGNPVAMLVTFLLTGTMGLLYAYGYTKTVSLYVPTAIHFGWNLTQGFVFSDGPIGNGLLQQVNKTPFRTDSVTLFLLVFFFPILTTLLLNFRLLKQRRQPEMPVAVPG